MPTSTPEPNPPDSPANKAWLITGTSTGLGRALVQAALARGLRRTVAALGSRAR